MSPTAAGRTVDQACLDAVELARAAAVELASAAEVGDHLEAVAEDERTVTHYFAAHAPGYVGWQWAVTVARASRSKIVTVDDACLLPGAQALVAPPWVPWQERLLPGDLGVGDLLETHSDDPRLVQGYTGIEMDVDDSTESAAELAWELGLGRPRVLSLLGLDEAVDRWTNGSGGPHSALAEAAPAFCASCGFVLRVGGLAGQAFGVCANEFSPSDGQVVSLEHGCGAHSEAVVLPVFAPPGPPVLDEVGYDDLLES